MPAQETHNGQGMTERIASHLRRFSPAWTAFAASALLSLLAIATSGTLNRDGMLYVDAARLFQQAGWSGAQEVFAWPFLPVLMAVFSQLTGFGPETVGYALNVLFMAGACALLVACAARLFPEAVWPTLLALLAIPGLNDYRDEVLREYGCWFFVMLAFWLALRWADAPRWLTALSVHAALGAAALFRPEALALLPALILWQAFEAPSRERWRRLAMIGALPLLACTALLIAYATGSLSGRLAGDLGRFSPERFMAKAQLVAQALPEQAFDQASTILFFGSLAIIPVKFIKMMGAFCIPVIYSLLCSGRTGDTLRRARLFTWAFTTHLLVLIVFVTDLHFLAGRYVAALLLFAVPITGYGFWLLLDRYPRWKRPLATTALLLALANVVSLAPGKRHFIAAGEWLAQNASDSPRVYVESARSAYYAGWRFSGRPEPAARMRLPAELQQSRYDLVVLEVSRTDSEVTDWLGSAGLREIIRFTHPNGDAVVVAKPAQPSAQESAANTSRSRAQTGSIE